MHCANSLIVKYIENINKPRYNCLMKMSGESKFTLGEAIRIKEYLKDELPVETMFVEG